MGYTTDFKGRFDLDKPLTAEHAEYLQKFSDTRRMKRDAAKAEALPDPVRVAAGLSIGPEGAFYVGAEGFKGQHEDSSVLDGNLPPGHSRGSNFARVEAEDAQPGLWCNWVPTKDLKGIEWNGAEKFYDYVEWLKYLIANFLKPWGYVVSGSVMWQGEDAGDVGKIVVANNEVTTRELS